MSEDIEAIDDKRIYDILPDWHRDDLRRLRVVPAGTRLTTGAHYIDLRRLDDGELTATGEETVGEELLVPKHDVDFEIWDKLLDR